MASSFTITPLSRIYRTYTGTFTDENQAAVTVASVDVAVLPRRTRLATAAPTWTAVIVTGGELRLLYAGPSADPTGALVVPADGADVYVRLTDNPEVDVVKLDTVLVS